MSTPLGLVALTTPSGVRVLVAAEDISTVREFPAHGDKPAFTRVTLRPPAHYESVDVAETLDEIGEIHADLILQARAAHLVSFEGAES